LLSFTKIFALTKINLGLDKGVEKPAISETLILLKKPLGQPLVSIGNTTHTSA